MMRHVIWTKKTMGDTSSVLTQRRKSDTAQLLGESGLPDGFSLEWLLARCEQTEERL